MDKFPVSASELSRSPMSIRIVLSAVSLPAGPPASWRDCTIWLSASNTVEKDSCKRSSISVSSRSPASKTLEPRIVLAASLREVEIPGKGNGFPK